jgi:Fe-S cluster biogenesis protein NfuA
MFIMTEETPNPLVLKFLPRRDVLGNTAGQEFIKKQDMPSSGFVHDMFHVDGIEAVYLGRDFISVTCGEHADWRVLKPFILELIVEHYVSGRSFITQDSSGSQPSDTQKTYTPSEQEIVDQIIELLETRVRPAVAADGGDIGFEYYDDGIVYVRLKGACSGCPSSTATLKGGIENMMRHYIPEVQEVKAV